MSLLDQETISDIFPHLPYVEVADTRLTLLGVELTIVGHIKVLYSRCLSESCTIHVHDRKVWLSEDDNKAFIKWFRENITRLEKSVVDAIDDRLGCLSKAHRTISIEDYM